MEKCIFCGTEGTIEFDGKIAGSFHRCANCGVYRVEDTLKSQLAEGSDALHLAAGYLYYRPNKAEHRLDITKDIFEEMVQSERVPGTTMQKLEQLLLYFYGVNQYIGQMHQLAHDITPPSIGYAKNFEELMGMVHAMAELGWLKDVQYSSMDNLFLKGNSFVLSTEGLAHAEQLRSTNIESKRVFVAMAFNRPILDMAMEEAIKPACSDCGYDAFLVSDREYNHGITDEIIVSIKQSKFVIADVTYDNSGAYFEAGYAQGLGREVIRCCYEPWLKEGNRLHFDIQHYNCILWENTAELKERLIQRIRATIPGAMMETTDISYNGV